MVAQSNRVRRAESRGVRQRAADAFDLSSLLWPSVRLLVMVGPGRTGPWSAPHQFRPRVRRASPAYGRLSDHQRSGRTVTAIGPDRAEREEHPRRLGEPTTRSSPEVQCRETVRVRIRIAPQHFCSAMRRPQFRAELVILTLDTATARWSEADRERPHARRRHDAARDMCCGG